ncbi:MAG: BsuPI-related putative proteinase inhibitor [bacterium]
MNTRLIVSLLCAGALAFACGPRTRSDAPAALATAQPVRASGGVQTADAATTQRPRSRTASKASAAKLDSHLKVDVTQHDVHFALNVTNVGSKHAEVDFPSGQSYDFVVVDSAGHEVWQWSHGHMFTQSVQNKQLGGGESMQVAETWKATAGRYTAIATLRSSNYPMEQRLEFIVP